MSLSNKRLRNPLKNARGLGSAKDGTGHFIVQRITAIALIFLSIYAVGLIICMIGDDYATVRATVAHPCHAILLTAFSVATFWHAKLGVQVIIEDYVHHEGTKLASLLLLSFACAAIGLASVLAVLKLALGI